MRTVLATRAEMFPCRTPAVRFALHISGCVLERTAAAYFVDRLGLEAVARLAFRVSPRFQFHVIDAREELICNAATGAVDERQALVTVDMTLADRDREDAAA